jgi:hypothetical protein
LVRPLRLGQRSSPPSPATEGWTQPGRYSAPGLRGRRFPFPTLSAYVLRARIAARPPLRSRLSVHGRPPGGFPSLGRIGRAQGVQRESSCRSDRLTRARWPVRPGRACHEICLGELETFGTLSQAKGPFGNPVCLSGWGWIGSNRSSPRCAEPPRLGVESPALSRLPPLFTAPQFEACPGLGASLASIPSWHSLGEKARVTSGFGRMTC